MSTTAPRVPRVLIVDDESSLRFLLRMSFEAAGYDVTEAHHGAAALALAETLHPDLVVTDFMMPVMDGGELVEHLRAGSATQTIPIILVTSTVGLEDLPVDNLLGKPVDCDEVLASAKHLLGGPASEGGSGHGTPADG